ncbi:hypothetical protein SLEP1_g36985 [Rubroshorea leprosula]|uniref:Uncharacterized protein n=1 Tax=Rubroshorea leprosula TaxID=152421 RepID=A0AAV5KTA5_9ROSI|nr:hypothetical protein SLEP1_g36985 [Rubroshorea leprosula]
MLQGDIPNKFLEGEEGKGKKGPERNHKILQIEENNSVVVTLLYVNSSVFWVILKGDFNSLLGWCRSLFNIQWMGTGVCLAAFP